MVQRRLTELRAGLARALKRASASSDINGQLSGASKVAHCFGKAGADAAEGNGRSEATGGPRQTKLSLHWAASCATRCPFTVVRANRSTKEAEL